MADDDTNLSDRSLVLRGLGWSSLGYPAITGLLFTSQVLAANLLVADDFGAFSLAVSIVTVAALVAQLGLPHSLLRRASSALAQGDTATARHEVVAAFTVGGLAATTCVALFLSPLGSEVLGRIFSAAGVAAVAGLIGVRAALRVLEQIVPEALRAFRDYLRVVLFDGLLTNLVLVVVLAVMLATTGEVSLRTVLVVTILVSGATLVPALATVAWKFRGTERARRGLRNPVEPTMWLSTIGRVVIAQLDLLVVGALGTSREIALYAAPFRLVLLVGLPLMAVNQVVTPLIAGWHAQGHNARLQQALRGTAGLAFVAASVVAVAYVIGGKLLLTTLFGPFYGDAYPVLVILVGGQLVQTWAGSTGFAMMMTGHHREYALLLGVSTVVTVGLDVLFYEWLGIEGVALATAGMLAVQNLVQVVWLKGLAGFTTAADPAAVWRELQAWRGRTRV